MTPNRATGLTLALLLVLPRPAAAEAPPETLLLHPELRTDLRATFDEPLTFARADLERPLPTWTSEGLWQARPAGLHGLKQLVEASPKNDPVWDPGSKAWYAFAYGALVKVEPDGSLPVVLAGLPGHDFDVRASRGLVVCRDTAKDQVVLLRTGRAGEGRVLLKGRFHNPRFSPDGSQVLVSELKDGGGHVWLVATGDGAARDLGRFDEPAWSPDGKQVLALRVEDDGHSVTASSLHLVDPSTGAAQRLATTRRHVVTRPAWSPDGGWLAFVDAASGQVMVARLPQAGGAR